MGKRVLDVCCGAKMFYFDKNNPDVEFCDNRTLDDTLCDGRKLEIHPDTVADFTDLPFESESFYVVVFDPPHLVQVGEKSWLAKKYGKLPSDWQTLIRKGFEECMRVLKPNGVLVFKWSEVDITVSEIIKTVGKEPVLGHKSGKLNKTHWLLFMK